MRKYSWLLFIAAFGASGCPEGPGTTSSEDVLESVSSMGDTRGSDDAIPLSRNETFPSDGHTLADGASAVEGEKSDGEASVDAPSTDVSEAEDGSSFQDIAETGRGVGLPGSGPGSWNVTWMHGAPDCSVSTDPPFQVHAYNEDTFILRQSKCLHFEAPFLYLLFGENQVFLQDTGAVESTGLKAVSLRTLVEDVIAGWLAKRGRSRDSLELLVTHSHSHGDHVEGDGLFLDQPGTTVVGTSLAEVQAFFGFEDWPAEWVTLDLGSRKLEITGIPGHHPTSLAVYDANAGLLLTGDTLYPGHLFISDYPAYRESIQRLANWMSMESSKWVLGTHIEMTSTPGVSYPYGTIYQPDEHPLQMPLDVLYGLDEALSETPMCLLLDDVSVEPSGLGCP